MDKFGRPTGPGKFSARNVAGKGGEEGILLVSNLFNYNFDGNLLKDEHKHWLDEVVIPFLSNANVHVKLHGVASRTGNAEYNRQLSMERVLRVKQYLISKGLSEAQVPGSQMTASGEDGVPADHAADDERDRAVRLQIALGQKRLPIPVMIRIPPVDIIGSVPPLELPPVEIKATPPSTPPITPPTFNRIPINVSRNFKIRLRGSLDGSLLPLSGIFSLGKNVALFELVDTENSESVFCVLPGVEVGGLSSPVSVTTAGEFKPFQTANPQRLTDFAGRASWNSLLSAGPNGKSFLTFGNIPDLPHNQFGGGLALEVVVPTGRRMASPQCQRLTARYFAPKFNPSVDTS